jgi:phosphatidylinositol glycan class W
MSNETSYKKLKEDFVSGLTGGSVTEINYVTAVAPVCLVTPLLNQSLAMPRHSACFRMDS